MTDPQLPPSDPNDAESLALPGNATETVKPPKLTERAHPLTPLVRGWVVLLAIIIAVGREFLPNGRDDRPLPPLQFIFAGVGGIALIAVLAGFVSWRFTRFVVDDEELRIDAGAIFRTSRRLAFERIQAIDVVQPFAARLFRLAEVQIDAGDGQPTRLRYLNLARAYELRDFLLARARGHRSATPTRHELSTTSVLADRTAEDQVLVRVPATTLVLAAVTSSEFLLILLGGAAWLWLIVALDVSWAVTLGSIIPIIGALFSFIGRRVVGQFNYTLSRRATGIRIVRGLTSLTSQSLPPRRIQAVQISQSLLWRPLRLYRIDLDVIGWGALGSGDEDGRDVNTILLPAGSAEQVTTALAAIWPTADYRQVPLTAAPTTARWLHPFSAPFLRWGFDDRLFVTQHGWLVRRWQLVPHSRAQSAGLTQGPISRRLRLANLHVHTAGTRLSVHAAGISGDGAPQRLAELVDHFNRRSEPDLSEAPG